MKKNNRNNRNKDNQYNRQWLSERQFKQALRTGDTQGRWITDNQRKVVLREVWRRQGQVYGQVLYPIENGYSVDLLGERAFMYAADAHPDTDSYIGEKLVFEIKHFETTQWKGRPQTNIIVTNNIYDKS